MSSRVILALWGAFSISCSPRVGEEPPPQKQIPLGATQCLGESTDEFGRFFKAESNAVKMNASFDCFESAFALFRKYVRGRADDKFTPQELTDFLINNFYPIDSSGNRPEVSPEFQKDLMKIKTLFVGGDERFITLVEVDRTIDFLKSVREIALKLLPHMPLLSQRPEIQKSQDLNAEFDLAERAVRESLGLWLGLFSKSHEPYKIDNLMQLGRNGETFFKQKWLFVDKFEEAMPLIKSIKSALIGGDPEFLGPTDWSSLLTLGGRGYVQFLRYKYFVEPLEKEKDRNLSVSSWIKIISESLSILEDVVRGKPTGSITRAEILSVLERISERFPEFRISDRLLEEAFRFKGILLGGSLLEVTAQDFINLKLKLPQIEVLTSRLLPFFDVYFGELPESLEEATTLLVDAERALAQSGQEFSAFFQLGYSLDLFVSALEEYERLYPPSSENSFSLAAQLKKHRELVLDVKAIVFPWTKEGTSRVRGPEILLEDWPLIVSLAVKGYMRWVEYEYYFGDQALDARSFLKRSILQRALRLVDNGLDILSLVLDGRKGIEISSKEISALIFRLQETGTVPKDFKPQTIESIISAVIKNLFTPLGLRLSPTEPKPQGLGPIFLSELRQELHQWLDVEIEVSKSFEFVREGMTFSQSVLLEKLKEIESSASVGSELQTGAKALSKALRSPVSMTTNRQGKVQISNTQVFDFNRESVFFLNASRMIARLLFKGFMRSEAQWKIEPRFNRCEAFLAFESLRGPFVDLGLIDIKGTFVDSRILDANIFVPRSNGNFVVEEDEFTDLISLIFSALVHHYKIEPELKEACPVKTDPKNQEDSVELSCLLTSYPRLIEDHMTAVPKYRDFMLRVGPKVWGEAFISQVKSAGWEPPVTENFTGRELVGLGSVALVPAAIQYMEMIMARFDKDRNDWLETKEVVDAFPTFESIITDFAKDYIDRGILDKDDMLAVFTYLVRYGEIPGGLTDILKFVYWKGLGSKDPMKWKIKADRVQVAEILGTIADEVAKRRRANQSQEETSTQICAKTPIQ